MKIYFKQPSNESDSSPFSHFEISDCLFKQLSVGNDSGKITRKSHHHNGFEIHIIEHGYQEYDINGKSFCPKGGEFLFIPPFCKHRHIKSTPETSKFSLTFTSKQLAMLSSPVIGKIPSRFFDNAQFIIDEYNNARSSSPILIENRVFECLVMLLRASGLREEKISEQEKIDNYRLSQAKEYINDNIENNLTVTEIASYCYISPKQLTRTFLLHEGMTPAEYIRSCRIAHIEKLLTNKDLSLKNISERMHFQNEYYFNSFVKKYLGIPPGTYRKMFR